MYWSNYAEAMILNTFRGITAVAPSAIYCALMLNNPGEAGGGQEISYDGYARQAISLSAPAIDSNGATVTNIDDTLFANSPSDAGTVTYLKLCDSLAGGNMLAYVELTEAIVVTAGVQPMLIGQELVLQSQGNFTGNFKTKTLNLLRGQNIDGFITFGALFNGNPDTGGAELTGGNYARFQIDFTAPVVQSAGQSLIENSSSVSSARSTSPWGDWAFTAICDAESAGNVVAANQQQPGPTYLGMSKAAAFPAGNIKVVVN